jgi:hypothetical protein
MTRPPNVGRARLGATGCVPIAAVLALAAALLTLGLGRVLRPQHPFEIIGFLVAMGAMVGTVSALVLSGIGVLVRRSRTAVAQCAATLVACGVLVVMAPHAELWAMACVPAAVVVLVVMGVSLVAASRGSGDALAQGPAAESDNSGCPLCGRPYAFLERLLAPSQCRACWKASRNASTGTRGAAEGTGPDARRPG